MYVVTDSVGGMSAAFISDHSFSLIADNHSAADIIHGLHKSVAVKTAALAKRAGGEPPYMMTGGVARNLGVVQALEERLETSLWIPEAPDLCGALGAALFALDSAKAGPG